MPFVIGPYVLIGYTYFEKPMNVQLGNGEFALEPPIFDLVRG